MTRSQLRRFFGGTGVGLGLLLSALVGGASCSGGGESLVNPCSSELTCGQACNLSTPCSQGQFCGGDSKCTAECIAGDTRCGSGRSCNGSGRCVDGIVIGLGGSGNLPGGGNTGIGGVCADVNINLDKQIPTVLLLVDQSGSMDAAFGTSDRWQVLRTSLMDPAVGVVNTLQAQVRFGLALYSGEGAQCPIITPVAPAMNNYAPIDAAFPAPAVGQPTDEVLINHTPTGESIDAAAAILEGVQELGQKVIVLATDGDPDSCADPDANGTNPPRELSIDAAQRAFQAGMFTFVISVAADAIRPTWPSSPTSARATRATTR
jgi:hypothetical protein